MLYLCDVLRRNLPVVAALRCGILFAQAGIASSGDYETKIDQYLAKSAEQRKKLKEKGGGQVHGYKPEDYGLTREQIHKEFADYINKYNLLE
jgi:hypothetical protein